MITLRKRTLTILMAALVLLMTTAPAWACPVCFSANKKSRAAFIFTTGLLSVMPWAMIGGGVFWYQRRLREHDADTAADEEGNPDPDSDSPGQ